MRFEPDCRFTKDIRGLYAVVDPKRALPGTPGPIISVHSSEGVAAAHGRLIRTFA
jgi:hypothetical protein